MSDRYPRARVSLSFEEGPSVVLRESVCIAFYLRHSHGGIAASVMRSVDAYRRAAGVHSPGWYLDCNGDWRKLDEKGWLLIQERLLDPSSARLELRERPDSVTGYSFSYRGYNLEDSIARLPNHQPTSAVNFWLPTEFLEAHGPGRVRELALELGAGLPFNSGHAGLAFHLMAWMDSNTPTIRERSPRHPGMDLLDIGELSYALGTKVRGPAWLTFLGQPVLGELGGVAGLRARLRSPGTTVQELENGRAVVTLGTWPEAGDLEQGDTLPHYRELARVLEPWLYAHHGPWGNLTQAEIRRWERRFLD